MKPTPHVCRELVRTCEAFVRQDFREPRRPHPCLHPVWAGEPRRPASRARVTQEFTIGLDGVQSLEWAFFLVSAETAI